MTNETELMAGVVEAVLNVRYAFNIVGNLAVQTAFERYRAAVVGGGNSATAPVAGGDLRRVVPMDGVTPELASGKASMAALAGILRRGAGTQKPRSKQFSRGEFNAEADARFILDCINIALTQPAAPVDDYHPLATMVRMDEELEADNPGWMAGHLATPARTDDAGPERGEVK